MSKWVAAMHEARPDGADGQSSGQRDQNRFGLQCLQRFRRELAQHPFVVEQKEAPAMGHLGHDAEVMA